MTEFKADELIQLLKDSFISEASAGINSSIQLDLSGPDGGQWYLRIKDRQMKVENGVDEEPDAEISTTTSDLAAIITGKLDPLKAFFSGRIRISGDQSAVVKMMSLFHVSAEDLKKFND